MLIRVITKLPNSEQFNKGKVKTRKYINRQVRLEKKIANTDHFYLGRLNNICSTLFVKDLSQQIIFIQIHKSKAWFAVAQSVSTITLTFQRQARTL